MADNQTFLDDANSSEKRLGHSLLQLENISLQKELEHLKTSDSEKEKKIGLFKKTIANLQTQLQERASKISLLEENATVIHGDQSQTILENRKYIDTLQSERDVLQTRVHDLEKQKEADANALHLLHKEHQDLKSAYEESQSVLVSIKTNFEKQIKDRDALFENNKTLQIQLDLKNNILDTITVEMEELKSELAGFRTQNESLQKSLEQTIQQLQEQLEHKQVTETTSDQDVKPPQVSGFPRTLRERRKR